MGAVLLDNSDRNPSRVRRATYTLVTFAASSGIPNGMLLSALSIDDTLSAIRQAQDAGEWLTFASVEGSPPVHVSPSALDCVATVTTTEIEIVTQGFDN